MKGTQTISSLVGLVLGLLILLMARSPSTALAAKVRGSPFPLLLVDEAPSSYHALSSPSTKRVPPIIHFVTPNVYHVTPDVRGTITEYAIPHGSMPFGITRGPDGTAAGLHHNLWFTLLSNDIGSLSTNGTFTIYPIPCKGSCNLNNFTASPTCTCSYPISITTGPDGNLWFTEFNANQIGKLTINGTFTEYPIPTSASYPWGITLGPDGNLWFTERKANQIGKITTSGTITEYPIPTSASEPFGITKGSNGNLWFTEASGNKIATINAGTGSITEYPIPTYDSFPAVIAPGTMGSLSLWFTEYKADKVGMINSHTDKITEYTVPTGNSDPYGLAKGADGKIWFSESSGNNMGRITLNGTMKEYPVPTSSSQPWSITCGPMKDLWFTELSANKIASITTK